jgi:hypothetical protein
MYQVSTYLQIILENHCRKNGVRKTKCKTKLLNNQVLLVAS